MASRSWHSSVYSPRGSQLTWPFALCVAMPCPPLSHIWMPSPAPGAGLHQQPHQQYHPSPLPPRAAGAQPATERHFVAPAAALPCPHAPGPLPQRSHHCDCGSISGRESSGGAGPVLQLHQKPVILSRHDCVARSAGTLLDTQQGVTGARTAAGRAAAAGAG